MVAEAAVGSAVGATGPGGWVDAGAPLLGREIEPERPHVVLVPRDLGPPDRERADRDAARTARCRHGDQSGGDGDGLEADQRPGDRVAIRGGRGRVLDEQQQRYLACHVHADAAPRHSRGAGGLEWRRARRTGRLPSRVELDSAARRVGWRKVRADSATRSIRLDTAGMGLDLGGIAKGYILDQALLVLGRHGVTRALIQAGGDIVAGDPPPGLPGWRVDVPGAGPTVRARATALVRAALSRSGDTEQFVIVAGVRYSHIVDPRTGVGLTSRRQAAVVAGDGLTADGLATALTVLDDAGQAALLRAYPGVVAEVWRAR